MIIKLLRSSLHFLFLVDINKLLTHSVSPIIKAGDLTLTYDFFALKTEKVAQYYRATHPSSLSHA